MNRLTLSLIVVLLASVGFNLFLWYGENQNDDTATIKQVDPNAPVSTASSHSSANYTPFEEVRVELDVEPLRRLLQKGEYIELGRRLNDALRALPHNLELLLMEAEFIAKTAPLSEAILNYYALLERPLDDATRSLVQTRIDSLVNKAIKPLKQERQWDLLAQFMEPLFQRMPDHKEYTLLLADAYGQQQNYTLMENALASLPELDPQAQAVRERAYQKSKTADTSSNQYRYVDDTLADNSKSDRLSLIRSGDQFLVDLVFGETPVRMLIDTGASITALSARTYTRLAEQYDSDFLGVFDVNTAGGLIRAPMVTFGKVSLGNFEFRNLTVVVIPTDPFDEAEGLLGMNLLKAFDFRIDQRTPSLLLREH